MANVHRIGDYQQNDPNGGGQRQVRMGGMFGGGGDQEAPGGGDNQEDTANNPIIKAFMNQSQGDPRLESFWEMLKLYF